MKKLLLIIFLGISIQGFSQAENKGKTDIYAGYGMVTSQYILGLSSPAFTSILVPGGFDKVETNGLGTVFLGFDYYITDKVALGLQANYSSFETTYVQYPSSNSKVNYNFITPLARLKAIWLNKPAFQLYSTAAGGVTIVKGQNESADINNLSNFAYQLSPLGVRIGKNFAVFGECIFRPC